MSTLLNPVALDSEGKLVFACNCERGDGPFSCTTCDEVLVLKKGEVIQHHFAHKQKSECNGESNDHKFTKFLLEKSLSMWHFKTRCQACGTRDNVHWDESHAAQNESKHGSLRLDVGVLKGGRLVGAVEVLHTHAVETEKWERLTSDFGHNSVVEVTTAAMQDALTKGIFAVNASTRCAFVECKRCGVVCNGMLVDDHCVECAKMVPCDACKQNVFKWKVDSGYCPACVSTAQCGTCGAGRRRGDLISGICRICVWKKQGEANQKASDERNKQQLAQVIANKQRYERQKRIANEEWKKAQEDAIRRKPEDDKRFQEQADKARALQLAQYKNYQQQQLKQDEKAQAVDVRKERMYLTETCRHTPNGKRLLAAGALWDPVALHLFVMRTRPDGTPTDFAPFTGYTMKDLPDSYGGPPAADK
jgi:hypothetical protein